jgi:type VI secretion system protein ImpA
MVESPGDVAALPPISSDDACGPDLDAAGDPEFLNFMAATEGLLPAAYFSFDRKTIDFPAAFEAADKLLARSQDLRLLVLKAKLTILNRDVKGFARAVASAAWLLAERWEDVHPRAEDGDYTARLVALGTLDDGPVSVLPLQYASLLETQRDGALVFRAQMVAAGEAKPRVGETLPSSGAVERILSTIEIARLAEAVETMRGLAAALAAISAITRDRVGFEQTVNFSALGPLVDRIMRFLNEALAKRDPTLAAAASPNPETTVKAGDAPAAEAPSEFATLVDADRALGAALGYFATCEPSSPARLLIAQARETLGKNLYEVIKLLAPGHADNARVFVGPDGAFTVPVSGLAATPSEEFARAAAQPALSRAAALALVDAVARHLRRAEPSSPAPFLLDRARTLASRDFLGLLSDVLPEDDLASMKRGR